MLIVIIAWTLGPYIQTPNTCMFPVICALAYLNQLML